jgi:hypothetical protein
MTTDPTAVEAMYNVLTSQVEKLTAQRDELVEMCEAAERALSFSSSNAREYILSDLRAAIAKVKGTQ